VNTSLSAARPRIAVLYGGRSAEHDVSVMSAINVMGALDPARYDVLPVYIDREGVWRAGSWVDGQLGRPQSGPSLALLPGGKGRFLAEDDGRPASPPAPVDLLFPMLHGQNGEDGSLQGLAQTARLPLVGCGILGSAVALDKDVTKTLAVAAGLPTASWRTITHAGDADFATLAGELGLPFFLKPARQGSSVGVSKVRCEAEFGPALEAGFRYDNKLLAEEFIAGREIECAVLEDADGAIFVSRPGEIAPASSHGFYSYDAKYVDADGATVVVPAPLAPDVEAKVRISAEAAFRAAGCDAMARVDFFLTADGRALLNEINTIPGFTDISMYPKAMAASGVPAPALIDRLIAQALARAAATDALAP
jgi:D-alanine-D-alanine ligase